MDLAHELAVGIALRSTSNLLLSSFGSSFDCKAAMHQSSRREACLLPQSIASSDVLNGPTNLKSVDGVT